MDILRPRGLQPGGLCEEEPSRETVAKRLICVGDSAALRDYLPQIASAGWEWVPVSKTGLVSEGFRDGQLGVAVTGLDANNAEAVAELVASHSELEWIAVAQNSDLENVRVKQVISNLFFDFHTLPIDVDRLLVTLGHAAGMAKLRAAGSDPISCYGGDENLHYHHIVGISKGMRSIYSTIDKAAPTDFPVLITGKSGTGKELVAKAIHHRSDRADRPLVILNCGSVVPGLIQSELFGHEKGSFTGADKSRKGHFEAADGGTIFLDEIGELPMEAQANLLRVLEEKLVRRVGGSSSIPTDVRVIAATNRKLPEAVAEGRFREDLLYRLAVVHIEIPPLCERRSDVELLANHYLRKLKLEVNSKAKGFSRRAVEAMLLHDWPGNVRELINRIKTAALLCENQLIQPQDLRLAPAYDRAHSNDQPGYTTLRKAKEEAEREALVQAMEQVNSNVSLAAQTLGVSRVTLYNLLKKHELR